MEIMSRGKRVDNGEWVYGYLVCISYKSWIKDNNDKTTNPRKLDCINYTADIRCVEVIPETVGQYTGLPDKNGKKIYNGDISRDSNGFISEIKYDPPSFYRFPVDKWSIEHGIKETVVNRCSFLTSEVIGNIHDNPELLSSIGGA